MELLVGMEELKHRREDGGGRTDKRTKHARKRWTVLIKMKVMMWVVLVLSDPMSENAHDACLNQQNTTSAHILCRSSSCFLDLKEFLHFYHLEKKQKYSIDGIMMKDDEKFGSFPTSP